MQLLLNGLIAGSLAALIAGGLALVYGVLGVFNLALGQLVLTGGYATWWLQSLGLSLPLSIIGGVIIAGIITWLTFEISIGPFYKRHRFLPLVTTIAMSMIFDALFLIIFQERPRSIDSGTAHFIEFANARVSTEQLTLIAFTLALLVLVAYVLHFTSVGRKIRATVQNSDAARSIGISSELMHRIVFIVSGILAALGGVFIGIDQTLTPVIGFTLTIKAYAAVVAGGKDNLWATILCAYLIAFVEQVAVGVPWWFGSFISAGYQHVVAFVCIILVILFRPAGIFARKSRIA